MNHSPLLIPFNQAIDALERHRGGTGINHALSDVLNQIREYHDLPISSADLMEWSDLDWSRITPIALSYLVPDQGPVNRHIGYGLLFHALKCGQELPTGTPERIMADQVTELLGTYLHKE